MSPLRSLRFGALLLGGVLAATSALRAAGGFTATLTTTQQAAAGLATLSPVEQLTLDQLVAGELAVVRRADAPEIAGTFTGRRTATERSAAGLDRLTPAQLDQLNEFVAAALAVHPKPKERPRLRDSDVFEPKAPPEIHGEVTVGYGWGGGGSVRFGSLQLNYYDPDKHFGISIGLGTASGSGRYGFYPYGYGGRYYDAGPLILLDPLYRDDFDYGDGQSFRGVAGDYVSRDGRRR